MNPDGPYLAVAALFDSVLQEKKDDRVSGIRLTERVTANTNRPLKEGEPFPPLPPLQIDGLIAFRSGKFEGTKKVRLELVKPNGDIVTPSRAEFPAVFKGGERGVNIILNLSLQLGEPGLYWFNVYLDDDMMTRMPLKLIINAQSQQSSAEFQTESSIGETEESAQSPLHPSQKPDPSQT